MAGVTWNYSENDFSSGKSPPLYNCLYSNVCVLTWTKCGRMNMLAQRNEKVYLCTRIWWKAPNEHNCAPKCTANEPKCVWQWLVCHALAWWVRCPRPHHRQRSDPPDHLDCVTRPLLCSKAPFPLKVYALDLSVKENKLTNFHWTTSPK